MSSSLPQLLIENAGLAFVGETPWPAGQLTARQAKSFDVARNPTGRPNADVLRHLVGFQNGRRQEHTQVDFPLHFTAQEAALYVKPFEKLQHTPPAAWLNPHAKPDLRTALARLERYLATPVAAENPSWAWLESQLLPEASLLAIARDDDFAHGLVQSRFFTSWWQTYSPLLLSPEIVMTFPFPWLPTTRLSSLTRTQEEHRLAIARAARLGAQDSLDAAVAAAYGCPGDLSDADIVRHLKTLNRERAESTRV